MAHKRTTAAKKAKPSFEVPADTGMSESAAGWVFRETDAPPEAHSKAAAADPPVPSGAKGKSDGMLAATVEVFVLSATSIGFATLAVMRLLEVPLAAGKMILPDRGRSA
jgi:hypothetical protein